MNKTWFALPLILISTIALPKPLPAQTCEHMEYGDRNQIDLMISAGLPLAASWRPAPSSFPHQPISSVNTLRTLSRPKAPGPPLRLSFPLSIFQFPINLDIGTEGGGLGFGFGPNIDTVTSCYDRGGH